MTNRSIARTFSDPSAPVAGAPIQISVIALESGQPASGRAVSGTITAKDGQPTAGETFTAVELGSGRYRIDIPALAQGRWTMRIQIGSPTDTADYSFAVSP